MTTPNQAYSALKARTITVRVEPHDIEYGQPNDSENCPLAWALRRRFPHLRRIAVGQPTVCLGRNEWEMDLVGRAFVKDFDDRRPVHPCTVTLSKSS